MAREYSIDLYNERGERITAAGGIVKVVAAGGFSEVALTNRDTGAALANPLSFVNGHAEFNTADSVTSVDIYGQAPDGRGFQVYGVPFGNNFEVVIDRSQMHGAIVIPFDIGEDSDISAATEFDTGFAADAALMFEPFPAVYVGEADATETIDVGTAGSVSDDPDGFMDAVPVSGTAGTFAVPLETVTTGSNEVFIASTTLGALFRDFNAGTDAATDVGTLVKKAFVGDGDNISLTLSAGSDTAAGKIVLPYLFVGV